MRKWKCLLLLGILLGAMTVLTGCGATTVNLNKYITIAASGYDSMGTASYTFDYDAFNNDYAEKIKLDSKNNSEISAMGLLSGETPAELLLDFCVSQGLSEVRGLSNGDTITLTWSCEDEIASQYFNCKLEYSDIEYQVSGLEEVDTFNPFEYMDISFSGISPNGSATITQDYNRQEMQYVVFYADKSYGLSNGDGIKVTAQISGSVDTFVEKFGAVLGETEKTYTVEGLPCFVTDMADIPSETMDKMAAQGEDVFRAYVANNWNKPENLHSVSLVGNYFLTVKPDMTAYPNNYLYFVYKISATNPEPEETVEFYYYIYYSDITALEDGSCSVDLSSYAAPSSGWFASETFRVGTYTYVGYDSLEALYNSCVVSKIDLYEYTSTVQ